MLLRSGAAAGLACSPKEAAAAICEPFHSRPVLSHIIRILKFKEKTGQNLEFKLNWLDLTTFDMVIRNHAVSSYMN